MSKNTSSHSRYYECRDCRERMTAASYRAACPGCDGKLQNIAVPRE
ncbi:rubrerythrin-like domain-containing protein [Haladaptatus sp. NG-SE-30]